MTNFLTVSEAAPLLGVSPREVRRLVRAGRLLATRTSAGWLLYRASVEGYVHRPRGRPRNPTHS